MIYLSEAVRDKYQLDKFNVIEAPCGCGKTYYAVNILPQQVLENKEKLHNVLYLIDSCAGRNGIIETYPDKARHYDDLIEGKHFAFLNCEKNKIVVMTYAKFGFQSIKDSNFFKNFKLIIADEFHNIHWPAAADRRALRKEYPTDSSTEIDEKLIGHSLNFAAMNALKRAAFDTDIITVGISATPNEAAHWAEWKEMPFYNICIADNVRHYTERHTISFSNIESVIRNLPKDEKTLIYASHISDIKRMMNICEENGFRCGAVWSENNTDHPLSDEQKKIRDTIIKTQNIPAEIDVLLINKSMETSVNIKSPVQNVIVYSENKNTQIQARGRIRSDIDCLYILENTSRTVNLKDKALQPYFGIPLDKEMKNKLVDLVGLRDKQGHKTKWTTLKRALIESGCEVSQTRPAGSTKKFDIIKLPNYIEFN